MSLYRVKALRVDADAELDELLWRIDTSCAARVLPNTGFGWHIVQRRDQDPRSSGLICCHIAVTTTKRGIRDILRTVPVW
jgi:hypothetical protein